MVYAAPETLRECYRLALDPLALKDVRVWGNVLTGQVHPAPPVSAV